MLKYEITINNKSNKIKVLKNFVKNLKFKILIYIYKILINHMLKCEITINNKSF